jgi:hypothetical protein
LPANAFLICAANSADSTVVPRNCRFCLCVLRVARWLVPACLPMLHLALGRDAKPLLDAFVCLLLGHVGRRIVVCRLSFKLNPSL